VPHALGGCRLKLERAVAHLGTLNEEIQRFRRSQSHELIRDFDPQTGEELWWVDGVYSDPPDAWSPLIGDILHNLRSALDHLARQLAIRRNYGHDLPSESRATFPIFKNRGRFWRKRPDGRWTGLSGATSLLRFPGDARKHVLAVQPYKDGNRAPAHPLWALHRLSIEDRHRTLHVVRSAIVDSALQIDEFEDARIERFKPITGQIGGRAEPGRVKLVANGPNPNTKLKPAFAVAETFGEGVPVVGGRDVGEVVNEIMKAVVNDIFRLRFAPYFEVDDWEDWQLTPGGSNNEKGAEAIRKVPG
jgi:hypothetical protein